MATSTIENYLKQIYLEQQSAQAGQASSDAPIPTGKLASAMGVTPSTATMMVQAMEKSGLVSYERRGGARLTPGGEQLALHVLRRHRLVELFLVKVLGLDWSEVHDEAEELEHAISDKVLERIDQLLGHPQTDPHGDPIPTAKGQMADTPALTLADCPLGRPVRVARIADQNPAFLQFVERSGLKPGVAATVCACDALADAVTVQPGETPAVTLGTAAAAKIFVEPRD